MSEELVYKKIVATEVKKQWVNIEWIAGVGIVGLFFSVMSYIAHTVLGMLVVLLFSCYFAYWIKKARAEKQRLEKVYGV